MVGSSEGFFGLAGQEHGSHGDIPQIGIEEGFASEVIMGYVGGNDCGRDWEFEHLTRLENQFGQKNCAYFLLGFIEAQQLGR